MTMTAKDVRYLLTQACKAAGSRKEWAKKHGMSAAYVSDVLLGSREPSHKICSAMGITRKMVYEHRIDYDAFKRKHGIKD